MQDRQRKYIRLQTRFLFGLAAILVIFATIAAVSIYFFQVNSYKYSAYRKADLIMASMAASRSYVRDVLRPKMYENLNSDDFIIEAMSSSYISRSIAERLEETDNDVLYRRVAMDARNENYEANSREQKMISYFTENKKEGSWHDVVADDDGTEHFMKFSPIIMEESCLVCHGSVGDAPKKVIEMYGSERGFNRKVGDVIGVVSVSLPIEINVLRAKEIIITVFLAVVPSVIFLYAIISVFYNRVVSVNLRHLLNVFRKSLKDERGQKLLEESQTLDEITDLNSVAGKIADHLQKNHNVLERYAHELYHSKELLQSVFDGISDPVILLSVTGRLKVVNKAFLKNYDFDHLGNPPASVYEIENERNCPISACRDTLESIGHEPVMREIQLENSQIFQVYFYPVIDDENELTDIVCYVKDVTEKTKMENHIQHSEKIISMGQVAAGVAHEINNPLGVILCHIDFIRDDENISEESRSDLAIIEKHVDNCKRIVSDLMRFSKPSTESKELCSFHDIASDVIAMLRAQLEKRNISLETEFAESLPEIYFDVDRFKQVVLNLILNSAHSIGDDGTIIIRTKHKRDEIVIEVEDNGPGISDDVREKIFEPFFTTKAPGQGTGLGLAVSYGIVRNHNGVIFLKDTTKNTCFTISIPIEENLHE